MSKIIARLFLHPVTSVAFVAVLAAYMFETSVVVKVVFTFCAALSYALVGPSSRRNAFVWRMLESPAPRSGKIGADGLQVGGSLPVIIVSYPLGDTDMVDHALAYSGSHFAHSGILSVCESTVMFRLPVARTALWLMGGVMQYSRALLLQLLKRRSGSITVTLHGRITANSVSLNRKGIFAAAIKVNAVIIPAFLKSDGALEFGMPVPAGGIHQTPTPNQVRDLAAKFADELKALHLKVRGAELKITN